MSSPQTTLAAVLAASCQLSSASAAVTLPPIFSDHCVLQRSEQVPVWGKANPGENVRVDLDGSVAESVADEKGRWRVSLDLKNKTSGPFSLQVEGENKLVVNDVVVGEVWLCSGQSNMEFLLAGSTDAAKEIAASDNPALRQFLVGKNHTADPLEECDGRWVVSSPATSGNFSAVAYYYGKALQKELGVPVGLINSSWGGTPSEAWTSDEALGTEPALAVRRDKIQQAVEAYPGQFRSYLAAYRAWERKYQRQDDALEDATSFIGSDAGAEGWVPVKLPGLLSAAALPEAGAVWLRKSVNVPEHAAGQVLALELGQIRDFDEVYWNGRQIGKTTCKTQGSTGDRIYGVPADLVKAGESVITIRLFNPAGGAGIDGPATAMRAGAICLAGEWQGKAEKAFPVLEDTAKNEYPRRPGPPTASQNVPAYLFNAMIHPLIPYAIQGVIWYQGEANADRAVQYRTSFPLLIKDWRTHWGLGNFPFYFCQLANYLEKNAVPMESDWAELREAQSRTLSVPETGQAVLIDLGEEADIHPRDKASVGNRLADIALARTYGKLGKALSPEFQTQEISGGKIKVIFKNPGSHLVALPLPGSYRPRSYESAEKPLKLNVPASTVQGFQICGKDRIWKWAEARIEGGNTVLVWNSTIKQPVAVRYGWSDNPTCNLYNKEGAPVSPFRTDDFPEITKTSL